MALALPHALPLPDTPAADAVASDLELLPIPAARLELADGGVALCAANGAFRRAGLGSAAAGRPMLALLEERIAAFLSGPEPRVDFAWQHGSVIDCRHYRVTLARLPQAEPPACQASFVDLTGQYRTEQSLRREMSTDSLTGLPNREGFSDMLEAGVAEGTIPAVLVVDINRFGRLNACLGGMAGDELLITVARRIKGSLRAHDTLARIGGDEFGIALAIEQADEAQHAARRIERVLAEPFRLTDFEISVEGSIGIAFHEAGGDVEELVRHAQFALKRAKATGRPEVYQNRAFAIERAQFAIETDLRRAIERRELRLTYQPIRDLATNQLIAVEALARWRTEQGVELPPSRFVPVAEESGLIVPLGRWAIEEATRTLAEWDRRAGGKCGIAVAVNLSPIQFQRDTLVAVVDAALRRNGLSGDRLKLELTESALIADPERTADVMRSLKALGTVLAMDDFGTGYSSLALLQKLPIDILKIDRSFVTGMLADRDKVAIVRAILGLAQALGMRTVAEGVETHELVQTLAAMGCTYGQGYFYARPLEAEDAWAAVQASLASA